MCTSFHTDLQAQRVSEIWLQAFLSDAQQAAIIRLSVFAGSFSAEGAAAVLADTGVLPANLTVLLIDLCLIEHMSRNAEAVHADCLLKDIFRFLLANKNSTRQSSHIATCSL